ncbi:MAG: D-alanyl-D-alanine carboxypeptidase/D-alanyl-D-alanine-endopeptidase [Planctomycetota bacterium]
MVAIVLFVVAEVPALRGSELRHEIDRLLAHPNLANAAVGVCVGSVTHGDILYSRAADTALIPASNTKLVTSASALAFLGPDWSFETQAGYYGELRSDGVLDGDLVLRGGGDPCLQSGFCNGDALEVLRRLARSIKAAGVKRVSGSLIVDASCFDSEYVGPSWPMNQLNLTYCAPVSGLSFNNNCLRVDCDTSGPAGGRAKVALWPATAHYRVESGLELVAERGVNQIALTRSDEQRRVRVRGKSSAGGGQRSFLVPVRDPPDFVGSVFLALLSEEQIVVTGNLRRASADEEGRPFQVTGCHRSPLVDALQVMNKESDNGVAEHVFKAVGARRFGVGSFATGSRAVQHLFRSLGVDAPEARFVDGSGLSRENRISPRALVRLMTWMIDGPYGEIYGDSLAAAGTEGTLAQRMTGPELRARVRAKSGYLREVSALAGFARTAADETLAFSILINGFSGSNRIMKQIQDDICRELVRFERGRGDARAGG